MSELLKLNLGGCDRNFPGFLNVDIVPPADVIADLAGPWPWGDSSVSEILAYDVLEHIPDCPHCNFLFACEACIVRRVGFKHGEAIMVPAELPLPVRHPRGKVHCMNELWRVLAPGGIARIEVPDAANGDGGFCDPTHATYWTVSDFEYYEVGNFARERFRNSAYYGVKADFKVLDVQRVGYATKKWPGGAHGMVWKIKATLEAVK